jgi:hypothetical protein
MKDKSVPKASSQRDPFGTKGKSEKLKMKNHPLPGGHMVL